MRFVDKTSALIIAAACLTGASGDARGESLVEKVSAGPASIAPTLGQRARLSFRLRKAGTVSVLVVDRDGYLVRTLARDEKRRTGPMALEWDGRDDAGVVVADEAYSFRISASAGKTKELYFPADSEPAVLSAVVHSYDRAGGTYSYDLPRAARVYVQAGTAKLDPARNVRHGPVLKTLVNREPRVAGKVVEMWNGFDESETIYLPDLPDFVTAVLATELPENSVIVVGGRGESFAERVAKRSGSSLFAFKPSDHQQHRGLSAQEDVSPKLHLDVFGASQIAGSGVWRLDGDSVEATVRPVGPTADGFAGLAGTLMVFRGSTEIQSEPILGREAKARIARDSLPAGNHIVAICWTTDSGPTATIAFRLEVPASPTPQTMAGGSK
ncbi:MAG: FlgD immunoglobulin-like domain containing protein [Thermoanaerobaculia bacterium]